MSNHLLLDQVIPIDFGFGYSKGKFKGKMYKQPSVVGEARRLYPQDIRDNDIQLGQMKTPEVFIPDYFVGDLSVRHSNTRYYSIGDDKANMWTTAIQLKAMLGYLAPGEEVFAVTGLPLDFYFDQLGAMNAFMKKNENIKPFSLQVGTNLIKDIETKIVDHHVVPQPMGACMNFLLDDRGQLRDKSEARQTIVVGDLGFHTFDLLVLVNGEIHRASHSVVDISIANAYKMVQEWLRPQVISVPDLYTLDAAMLDGHYQGISLTDILGKMCEALARQIQFAIDSLNIKFYKYIGTGGWSSLVTPLLDIKEDNFVIYGQDGNINGYKKIGVRKCLT